MKSVRYGRIAKIFQARTEERQYSSRSRWPIKQGYSFLFYWDHKYPHAPSATGSIKWKEITRAVYFTNTSTKVFCRKKAAESGVTATLRYYSKTFPDLALKKATVRRFKNNYLLQINDSTRPTDLQELPCKKRGRPLLIGDKLDIEWTS